jgi:2-keto-4-pentenoate hydratase/2-oxohepta-3-ene-1,7-dioic acid hydratase in catechol pathway
MQIATYKAGGKEAVGVVVADAVANLAAAYAAAGLSNPPKDMLALIAGGAATLADVRKAVAVAEKRSGDAGVWTPLSKVKLSAPIPRLPKNAFCVGRNYKLHIEEGARARGVEPTFPTVPEFFSKPPTAVVGDGDAVELHAGLTKQLDYEVELAIVIGKTCRDVPLDGVDDVVFGYTIANDVTARDLQRAHGQWFKGKGLDTSLPCGPWIVTADAFGEPSTHRLKLSVNGEVRQDETIADMLFDCRQIVASLSAGLTLEPGDIICTGTPSGVGLGFSPPRLLKDGDEMVCEITGIGRLTNRVVAARRG